MKGDGEHFSGDQLIGIGVVEQHQLESAVNIIIIIIIIISHSLRRACLQPATNTHNSKPRPPTTVNIVHATI